MTTIERKYVMRSIIEACGPQSLSPDGRLSTVAYKLGVGMLNSPIIPVCRTAFIAVYDISVRMMKQIRLDIKLGLSGEDCRPYLYSSAAHPMSIKKLQEVNQSICVLSPEELSDLKMSSGYRTQMVSFDSLNLKHLCFTIYF
jgi:hypothetical protein